MNHGLRVERLQLALQTVDCLQLLVSNPLNIRWLTGFTGSSGQVLVSSDGAALITDSRYTEQAGEEVSASIEVVTASSVAEDGPIDHLIGRSTADAVGFEADHLTVTAMEEMRASISKAGSNLSLTPTSGVVAQLRRTKDADEVDALRSAAKIADDALVALLPKIRPGETELWLARLLEWEMAERGSERVSFSTILASGPNGAKPHARPSDRVLEDGDLVVIDFGATVHGYGSDMTRTLVVGGNPTAEQERWYNNVWAAQQVGVNTVQVGNELRSIHQATLDDLTQSGQDGVYEHGTGHGVGLFIHESPILSVRAEGVVAESMALTVEPGAYLPGVGGIRVEDLVITTASGPETLTNFPKGLAA